MSNEQNPKTWRARAVCGGKNKTQLMLARFVGESVIVKIGGEILEVTVIRVDNNSVALMFETEEKNLILRKELAT